MSFIPQNQSKIKNLSQQQKTSYEYIERNCLLDQHNIKTKNNEVNNKILELPQPFFSYKSNNLSINNINMTKLVYTNIRSLNNGKHSFIKTLASQQTILILTETWGFDINLPNKTVLTNKRINQRGGSVLIAFPYEWKII